MAQPTLPLPGGRAPLAGPGEERARGSFRSGLSRLRALRLAIETAGDNVSMAVASDLDDLACAAKAGVSPERVMALAAPFLEGVEADEGELADWLSFESTRCRTLAQQALNQQQPADGGGPSLICSHL